MGNTSFLHRTVQPIYGAERLVSGVSAYCKHYGQATKSMRVDALAQVGDEGRGQLR